jgi:Fe-S cluster biogenesis protein NfuA
MEDAAVRERVGRVEELLAGIEGSPSAVEAVAAVVELYGEALRRIVAGGVDTDDELVSHLLLLHGLHPVDVETRVARALDEVRPYLGSHGGDVELLGVSNGIARVRLVGTCDGCPSSAATLQHAIEEAVARAAPELEAVVADGVVAEGVEADSAAGPAPQQLLQIGSLQCPSELVSQ